MRKISWEPGRLSLSMLVPLLSLVHFVISSDLATANLLLGHTRPPMILPLILSPSNSSRAFSNLRRHLLRSDSTSQPNARMALYDDLLVHGYYTTRLWIGSPPQRFSLIVDTGSTVTYVPCSNCEQCGRHEDPQFQPEFSSTYQSVKCNPDCNCDNDMAQCIYERQYAEMSSSSGILGEDIISFGNQSELVPQRAVFGCEIIETGDLYSQHADGIMGLGRGDLSIVDQLVEKHVITDSFSLCYGGMDIGGGAMVLGGITPPSDMVFSHSDPTRSPYYNIDLKEIHVAGKQLPLNPRVFDGKHGTVLDSGTTYAYLPEEVFLPFKDAIMNELNSLKKISGPDPNYNDICFSDSGSNVSKILDTFPVVDMVFDNGQKLSLSPENYLFRHSKVHGAYCLGVFPNGRDPTTLLGGIVVRNTLVMYDREHSRIGFWKTNCSELWERLHISGAPPPVPSVTNADNRTAELAPSLAPNRAPPYELPREVKVGRIEFDLLLNISSYKDLDPSFAELPEFIAHELKINTSQVDLLNLSPVGNGSLIRFAILPAGSAKFLSKETVISIISQIAEHRTKLPHTYGTYQLVRWNVEPPSERPWWQQHYLAAILAVVAVLLVLSASGMWFIWKRRQPTSNSYKPVSLATPEQELQPLQQGP